MPQLHNIEEAKEAWKAARPDAVRFYSDRNNGPVFSAAKYEEFEPWPMGPTDPMCNIYPFVIKFTPWRNGSREWRTYVVTWNDNVIEQGTW